MAEVRSYVRMWPFAFAAVGVAGLGYAAFKWMHGDEAGVAIADDPTPDVDTGPNEHLEKVRQQFLDEYSTYVGTVSAGSPIPVSVPDGYRVAVSKVNHEPGDAVQKGEVLITFNRPAIDKAIEQDKARGDTAAEQLHRSFLDYVELKAPCDGVVLEIMRTLGEIPIDGLPVVYLADAGSFRFTVQVPGAVQSTSMTLGKKFSVELQDERGVVKGVVVQFNEPVGDEVPVVLALDPHDGMEAPLSGSVRVPSGRKEAGLVPKSAVKKVGDVSIVRMWDRETSQLVDRTVKLGEQIGPDVVVLAGVYEGDSVIVPGKPPQ